ncbi:MAG: sodium:solute symporter, partial [Chloroflexota bacterium]|nr:sodium:solute symporter [Chloroflexota bacterium]
MLDIFVIGAFFVVVVAITVACARKGDGVDGYFLAGRSAKSWIVGLSFIGTSVSSLSFLAFPAAAYLGNWAGLVPFLVTPLIAIFADRVCIPYFRNAKVSSAYELLEQRFGTFARLYGSTMFLLLQIGRAGLILVLLSVPLTMLTGMSQSNVILLCGIFTTLYVLVGGLTAVMITDALQTILLAVGGLVCVAVMCANVPGGLGAIVDSGLSSGKIGVPPWSIPGEPWTQDFVQLTLIVLLMHGFFNQLLYYTADQNVVQRYLAVGSARESRIGLWIGSLGMVGVFTFFTFLGTCLYVFYQSCPDPAVSQLPADEVFPHFILTQLPPGVVGLIIAAVVAAAMSSLDSNLNAVAMVFLIDIYRRHIVKNATEAH